MGGGCRFRGPVCPEWLQEQLLSWLIEGAEAGRPGFKEMLTLTPCDIFPLLRGRTLWLMGDSMMQVRARSARSSCAHAGSAEVQSSRAPMERRQGKCFQQSGVTTVGSEPHTWCKAVEVQGRAVLLGRPAKE